MNTKCVICNKSKGKRICQTRQQATVCSPCCAVIRNDNCEGCHHYTIAKNYQASQARSKPFVIGPNLELGNVLEQALGLLNNGNLEQTKAMIDEMLPTHSNDHQVHYAMGLCHAMEENVDEAISSFERAIQIHPYFVEAHHNLATAYEKKLQFAKMIRSYQKVIEVGDPHDECVHTARNTLNTLSRSAYGYHGISLESYLKGLNHFDLGFEAMQRQDWEQAMWHFKASIMINPTHSQSFSNKGICLAKLGKKAEAVEALTQSLKLDPDYEPAVVSLAIIENLEDGESLPVGEVNSVYEYAEFSLKKRPYTEEMDKKIVEQ